MMTSAPDSVATRPNRFTRLSPNLAALIAVILIDVLIAAFVAQQIVTYRDYPFDADEAIHANGGLALALDLEAGDVGSFAADFYRQGFYPPAFSPLKALTFVIFGASPLVARLFSLVCLCLAVLVIFALSLKLDGRLGWLIGLIAAGLTLTGQVTLVTSAQAIMEAPGLLVSFALLWAYLEVAPVPPTDGDYLVCGWDGATERPTAPRLALAGLLLTGTFLTKYTYGLVAVATLVGMEALAARRLWAEGARRPLARRRIVRRWVWLFGPFVLAMVVWFAQPYKVEQFFAYATAQPRQAWLTVENVVFYPRSIALHYALSPLFAPVMLAGVVWAAVRWHDERLRLLLIYFVIGMLEMAINLPKNPRFVATYIPAAHVLTGAMVAWLAAYWREGWSRTRGVIAAVAIVLVVSVTSGVPVLAERFAALPSLMQVAYETDPRVDDLAAWIAEQVPAGQRFFLVNPWDQFSGPALEWHLATHDPRPGIRLADVSVPWVHLEKTSPERVEALQREIHASGATYVVALEGGPHGAPVWWEYAAAMGDALIPLAQRDFVFEQYDVGRWDKQSLLTRDEFERVKSAGRYTLNIRATVYRLTRP